MRWHMNIERFYAKLDRYYSGTKSYQAENFLVDSLRTAIDQKDYPSVLIVCNELGGFYRAMGRYPDAVPVYLEAINALRKLGMFRTENHATTLINQATNYAVWGKSIDALELFEAARFIFENLGITVDFRIAALHNNMSIVCQDMEDFNGAIEHLNEALKILCQLEDTEIEVATTYTNLAQIKLHAKDYDGALIEIEKSLALFDSAKALTDTHYSVALETHGDICDKLGMYADALVSYQKAAMLVREQFGEDHRGYQSLVFNVGKCQRKLMRGENK